MTLITKRIFLYSFFYVLMNIQYIFHFFNIGIVVLASLGRLPTELSLLKAFKHNAAHCVIILFFCEFLFNAGIVVLASLGLLPTELSLLKAFKHNAAHCVIILFFVNFFLMLGLSSSLRSADFPPNWAYSKLLNTTLRIALLYFFCEFLFNAGIVVLASLGLLPTELSLLKAFKHNAAHCVCFFLSRQLTRASSWRCLKIKKLRLSSKLCDPAGTRTQDPYIKSVLLYQLSYRI